MFKKIKAFSLLEIILSVALFMVFGAVLLRAMVGVPFDFNNSADRMKAQYLLQEGQEAITAIRNYDWDELTVGGPHGIDNSSGYWELSGSSDTVGAFTRTITITEVNSSKYDVEITVTWTTDEGMAQSSTTNFRVTNWEKLAFIIDSFDEFNAGFLNGVQIDSTGYIELSEVGDFSLSEVFVTENPTGNADPTQFTLVKNKLYMSTLSNSGGEFFLYDVKDISQGVFTEVASTEISANVNGFAIQDDYAYLATSGTEVQVVDLSDMTVVETLDLTEAHDANDIFIDGDDLVVVRDETDDNTTAGELYLIDASNPLVLSSSGYALLEYDVYDVAVAEGYAFVVTAEDASELEVYELSSLTQVNSYDFSGNRDMFTLEISEDGEILYLGRESGGDPEFYVFDVSDVGTTFTSSEILGSEDISSDVYRITISGDDAYLAVDDNNEEIQKVDLSTYSHEFSLNLDQSSGGRAVAYFGAHIYGGVEDDDDTIQVLQTATGGWAAPSLVDSDNLPGNRNMFDIVVDGSYAYLGRDSGGTCNTGTGNNCEFVIYDISSPTAVAYEGGLEIGADVNDIYIDGDYAYLATDGTELQVVDISTKSAPSLVGSFNADSGANGESVWGSGNYVYLGTSSNSGTCLVASNKDCELYIIDVSTPSSPSFVSGVEVGTTVNDIQVNGAYVYLGTNTNSAEIRIVDVSAPSLPILTASYNHSGNGNVTGMYYNTSDDSLHLALTANGSSDDYSILDFSSSASSPSAQYGLSYNQSNRMVTVSGDYAFVVGDHNNQEIKIIDVSTISSPVEVGVLALSSDANGVATDGTYVFVASEENTQELQVVGQGTLTTTTNIEGMYVSEAFDSTVSSPSWGDLEWSSSGTGTVELQIRTASSEAGLDYATWVGASGDPDAFFSSSPASITPYSGASGDQYLQVAVFLSGNGSSSPQVDTITINYTP